MKCGESDSLFHKVTQNKSFKVNLGINVQFASKEEMTEKGQCFLIPNKSHTLLLSLSHCWELIIWPQLISRVFEKYGPWISIYLSATSLQDQWGAWIIDGQLQSLPNHLSWYIHFLLLSYSYKLFFFHLAFIELCIFKNILLGSNMVYQVFITCLFALLLFNLISLFTFLTLHYSNSICIHCGDEEPTLVLGFKGFWILNLLFRKWFLWARHPYFFLSV